MSRDEAEVSIGADPHSLAENEDLHYEILAKIGAGGMGEVYRARDTKLDRDVALKILPDAFTRDNTPRAPGSGSPGSPPDSRSG